MSRIREACEEAASHCRALMESRVADATEDRPALFPTVRGWRGEMPVITMIPFQVDRDAGLQAARIAATGFACDVLAFTVDTWSVRTDRNPVTGKRWGPGQMQEVVEKHRGLERGWVTDCLYTVAVNRAGDLAATSQNYTLTERTNALGIKRWTIQWTETMRAGVGGDHDGDPREHQEGIVPEALIAYMNEPTVQHYAAKVGLVAGKFGLDEVEAQAHADMAVVRSLRMAGFSGGLLLMSDDPRRAAVMEGTLERLQGYGFEWMKGAGE